MSIFITCFCGCVVPAKCRLDVDDDLLIDLEQCPDCRSAQEDLDGVVGKLTEEATEDQQEIRALTAEVATLEGTIDKLEEVLDDD